MRAGASCQLGRMTSRRRYADRVYWATIVGQLPDPCSNICGVAGAGMNFVEICLLPALSALPGIVTLPVPFTMGICCASPMLFDQRVTLPLRFVGAPLPTAVTFAVSVKVPVLETVDGAMSWTLVGHDVVIAQTGDVLAR